MVERKWVEGATTSRRLLVETLNFHWKLVCTLLYTVHNE